MRLPGGAGAGPRRSTLQYTQSKLQMVSTLRLIPIDNPRERRLITG